MTVCNVSFTSMPPNNASICIFNTYSREHIKNNLIFSLIFIKILNNNVKIDYIYTDTY